MESLEIRLQKCKESNQLIENLNREPVTIKPAPNKIEIAQLKSNVKKDRWRMLTFLWFSLKNRE